MKPKRKSRIETERKIFEASISIFSKYGYEAASLKQIAKKAGVNEALIIRYYKSKSKLLSSILFEYFRIQDQTWKELPEYETVEEEIREFLIREIRSDFEHLEFTRIVLARMIVDSKLRREITTLWSTNDGDPELIRRLKKFQDFGSIPNSADLSSLSYMLQMESLGLGLIIRMMPNIDQKLIESRATQFAAIFARGLLVDTRKEAL